MHVSQEWTVLTGVGVPTGAMQKEGCENDGFMPT